MALHNITVGQSYSRRILSHQRARRGQGARARKRLRDKEEEKNKLGEARGPEIILA